MTKSTNRSDFCLSPEDRLIDPAAKTSESQTTSNSAANEEEKLDELDKSGPTVEEVAILKEELEQLKEQFEGEMISNLKESVQGLEEELTASRGELAKLKGQVDGCRSEVTITFELKGIEALLAGSAEGRNSKSFTCGGELEIV